MIIRTGDNQLGFFAIALAFSSKFCSFTTNLMAAYTEGVTKETNQIFVKTLTGKTLTLNVDLSLHNVQDLSLQILSFTGINPEHQLLTYCGKVLSSNRSLKYYKLNPFCTIDLSLKLLSSPTDITVKIREVGDEKSTTQTLPFTPLTTLKDIRRKTKGIRPRDLFVHNGQTLKNKDIRIQQIENIWMIS